MTVKRRLSGHRAELDIINKIDFSREFSGELRELRKLITSKSFTSDKKKQKKLDDLLIGIDRKTLAREILGAMQYGDQKLAHSLQLVYWEKYLKGKIAKEAGIPEKQEIGIKIYLPEQNKADDKGVQAKPGASDGVSPED